MQITVITSLVPIKPVICKKYIKNVQSFTNHDGCQVVTTPRITLWAMWGKKTICALIENYNASLGLNIQHLLVKINMHETT